MLNLNKLASLKTSRTNKPKKRIGRGYGSGVGGHTSTKGSKGQKSRTGGTIPYWFEGGQLPLVKRMPHNRGFKPVNKKHYVILGLSDIEEVGKDKLTPEILLVEGYVSELKDGIKILANGDIKIKVELSGFLFTKSAKEKIEKAGGKIS